MFQVQYKEGGRTGLPRGAAIIRAVSAANLPRDPRTSEGCQKLGVGGCLGLPVRMEPESNTSGRKGRPIGRKTEKGERVRDGRGRERERAS